MFQFVLLSTLFVSFGREDKPSANDKANDPKLPRMVDLRPKLKTWGLTPRSQGRRNTCSVFVAAGALEFAVSKHERRSRPLSVEYLNWACNQVIRNKTQDRGQFFHDILKGFNEFGVCLESQMPYQKAFDPALKPSTKAIEKAKEIQAMGLQVHWIKPWTPQAGLTDAHLKQVKTVLAKGYPVAAGASHSRLLVGYTDDSRQPGGGAFLAKDSGAAAYNTLSYKDAQEQVADLFWVEAPDPVAQKK